jgi:hypothetical protein
MQTLPGVVCVITLMMTNWAGCTGNIENVMDNARVLHDGLQDIFPLSDNNNIKPY